MRPKNAELLPLWEMIHCAEQSADILYRSVLGKEDPSVILKQIEQMRKKSAALVQECTNRIQDVFITALDAKTMLYLLFYHYKLVRSLLCTAQFLLSEQGLSCIPLSLYLQWLCRYIKSVCSRCETGFLSLSNGRPNKIGVLVDTQEGEDLSLSACRQLTKQNDCRQKAVLALLRQCENTAYDLDVYTLRYASLA